MEKNLLKLEHGQTFDANNEYLDDEFQGVEFQLVCPTEVIDERKNIIRQELSEVDEQLAIINQKVAELNSQIDTLTNHSDGLDYAIAVASGVLTGLIDSFFVGEIDISIESVQKKLEEKYHTANDSSFKHKTTNKDGSQRNVSSPNLHRLEDLAHHPTLAGLIAAIFVRFFRIAIFSNGDGKTSIFFIEKSNNPKHHKKEMHDMYISWSLAVLSGLMVWLANVAQNKYKEDVGQDVPEPLRRIIKAVAATPAIIDILLVADTWIGHIMSDVSTPAGVPGLLLSLLKEISMLPFVSNTKLPKIVQELYTSEKMSVTKYAGVAFAAVKKQSMPILINEVLVRGFYFVRRLISEFKEHKNIMDVDWQKTIPFGNRTIARMLTIATGTFTAVDLADAGIRAVIKSGGFNPATLGNFVLNVNFVGVGRFAIAVVSDVGMGIKKGIKENKRLDLVSEQLRLMNVKVSYQQADMWIAAEDAGKAINEAYEMVVPAIQMVTTALEAAHKDTNIITETIAEEEKKDAMLDELLSMLG